MAGAALAVVALVWELGIPPPSAALDAFVWVFFGGVALFGASVGAGVVLAWRHAKQSSIWIICAAVCLLVPSALIVLPFINSTRANTAFLAAADSTRGAVVEKFVRGGPRLWVTYEVSGQQHRLLTPGVDWRYDQWVVGDSVWVYFQASAPDSARIGRFGPDAAPMLKSLAWTWGVGGVLLLAYLPPVVLFLYREWRGPAMPPPIRPQSNA
jgi:hypothetical protein